jgi:hypothetical protein
MFVLTKLVKFINFNWIIRFERGKKNSSFIFLAFEDALAKKINVLFERWLF